MSTTNRSGGTVAGVLVTAIFAATGAYFTFRVIVAFSWIDRVNNLTHVVMAATMILTSWPALSPLPVFVQIFVFAAATLWYVYLLAARSRVNPGPLLGHHGGLGLLLWYHAFMMASMIWMAIAMSPFVSSEPGMPDIPGMSDVPGTPGMLMGSEVGITVTAGQAIAVSTVLGVLYLVAGIWLLILFIAGRRTARGRFRIPATLDATGGVAMAAGMAIAFLFLMG